MGQCCSHIEDSSRYNSGEDSEEDMPHRRNSDRRNADRQNLDRQRSRYSLQKSSSLSSEIDTLISDMLSVIRFLVHNDQEPPEPLMKLHGIADKDGGWIEIICALIRVIPMHDPLGQLVITLVLDDCPLPTKESVGKLSSTLGLSVRRAVTMRSEITCERNTCVILGCIAETLAGPNSVILLNKNCLEYLLAHLKVDSDPNVILFALIALEKFAQTRENKTAIIKRLREEDNHPLLTLESFVGNQDYVWRQVGFCAQWCLDNLFILEGRKFSYEEVDQTNVNVMLNANDVSQYLKIAANGLEARCDSHSFESVRCTFQVDSGCWYYETLIITQGVMQIGWATRNCNYLNHDGYGIGDDAYSLAYDGCRKLIWFQATPQSQSCDVWKPGDILGCLLNIDKQYISFYLNGTLLVTTDLIFTTVKTGFFAAASFMSFQQCKFNFGAEPFEYPPENETFQKFNQHATLSESEKTIFPRHVFLNQLRDTTVEEDSCTLCCERKAAIILDPCKHKGFCYICSNQLLECPFCRAKIDSIREHSEEKTDE